MFTTSLRTAKRLLAAALLVSSAQAHAALLYDASLGTLPSQQGWFSSSVGGTASVGVGAGVYTLNTTSSAGIQAGNARGLAQGQLNTQPGFDLGIGLDVVSEAHASSNDRAGFSLLIVGANQTRALELAFWSDEIWAYTPAFAKGTGTQIQTSGMHDYMVQVRSNGYTLYRDGAALFSGALVDYPSTPGNLQTLIYDSPRSIFFGDDTTRASASVRVSYVSYAPVPLPGALALSLPALLLLARARRRG